MKLSEGKPPHNILEDIVFKYTGAFDPDLVQGPGIGEDAGIVRAGDGFIVAHSDPITAATRRIGWLSIHVSANDVAVRGVWPRWFLVIILLPIDSTTGYLEEIMRDIDDAAKSINATVIGGHTEVTPGIPRPILVSTAIGYTRGRVVRTCDALSGDYILLSGRIGGEGASVIAWDFSDELLRRGVSRDVVMKAREYLYDISVVEKALSIKDYVSAMHDPTEGGVLQGLLEIAIASGKTIVFEIENTSLDSIVETIVKTMELDPYRILSSGLLIACIPEQNLDDAVYALKKKGFNYMVCGRVVDGPPQLVVESKDKRYVIRESIVDEIYRLWK